MGSLLKVIATAMVITFPAFGCFAAAEPTPISNRNAGCWGHGPGGHCYRLGPNRIASADTGCNPYAASNTHAVPLANAEPGRQCTSLRQLGCHADTSAHCNRTSIPTADTDHEPLVGNRKLVSGS